jgi:branched-subunit amino acid transport protein
VKRTKKASAWFIKTRGSYLPQSWQAWLSYVPYLAYLIGVLVFVLQRHDSLWLAIFTTVPNWIAASVIMTWIAKRMS